MSEIIDYNPVIIAEYKGDTYLIDIVAGGKKKIPLINMNYQCVEVLDNKTIFYIDKDTNLGTLRDTASGEILQELDNLEFYFFSRTGKYLIMNSLFVSTSLIIYKYGDRRLEKLYESEIERFIIYKERYLVCYADQKIYDIENDLKAIKETAINGQIVKISDERFYYHSIDNRTFNIFHFNSDLEVVYEKKLNNTALHIGKSFYINGNIFFMISGSLYYIDVDIGIIKAIVITKSSICEVEMFNVNDKESDYDELYIDNIEYLSDEFIFIDATKEYHIYHIKERSTFKIAGSKISSTSSISVKPHISVIDRNYVVINNKVFNLRTLKYEHIDINFKIVVPYRLNYQIENINKLVRNVFKSTSFVTNNVRNLIAKFI